MEAWPGSAHFSGRFHFSAATGTALPKSSFPRPVAGARGTPGVRPARALQGARCGVPNAFGGDTPPRAALAPPRGREDSGPPRLSPMETHLGVALGSQRVVLGPDFEILAAHRPLPAPCHRAPFPSRGAEPVPPTKGAPPGDPLQPPPAKRGLGEPWAVVLHCVNFVSNLPAECPPPGTPGYCREGRGFEAGPRAEGRARRCAGTAPQTGSIAGSRGRAAASGRGPFLRAPRLAREAFLVRPGAPAVAAGRHGSDAGETTSSPRQPSPAGLRTELSKLAGRESARRAARGERRTRKMASGARGLGSRGAAGPRGAAGGAGLRWDSRTPRSAASTTAGAGQGPFLPGAAVGERPPDPGGSAAGRRRSSAGGVLRARHQAPERAKPFGGRGAVGLSTPVTVARVLSSKSRSARPSLAGLAYLPLQGGLRPRAAAPGQTSLPRSLSSPVRRPRSLRPGSQRAPPGRRPQPPESLPSNWVLATEEASGLESAESAPVLKSRPL